MKQWALFFLCIALLSSRGLAQVEISRGYYSEADTLIKQGRFSEACEMYKLFIDAELNIDTSNWVMISEAYNNMGVCRYISSDYENSARFFEEALKIMRKEGLSDDIPGCLNNLGMVYQRLGNYDKAIQKYEQALELSEQSGEIEDISKFLNNIGSIYDMWGKYDRAIIYFERSLRIKEEMGNQQGMALSLNNIGMVYNALQKFPQAIENFNEALSINKEIKNEEEIATNLNNIGLTYYNMEQYDSALVYYQKALGMNARQGANEKIAVQYNNIGLVYFKQKDYEKAKNYLLLALKVYRELGQLADVAQVLSNLGNVSLETEWYAEAETYLLESKEVAEEIRLKSQLQIIYKRLSLVYENTGQLEKALHYFKESTVMGDSLFTEEVHRQVTDFEVKYETERKEKELEINRLQIRREKTLRNSLIAGLILLFALAGVIFWALRLRTRDNRIIENEKAKSDKLLLNILPSKVASDLKERGATISETYDHVSVFFSDLVGFTDLSAGLEPDYLISELNDMFTRFDEIIEKHHCERIKTIGDAYMAVCGLPVKDEQHAQNMLSAAAEILEYMKQRRERAPVKWEIRIGLHSGSVTAGVVGVKKYIYDVFGDAVNTASRMESNSEPMKINVSETTYALTKDKFSFIERPPIEIKGKGKMRMYFLDTEQQ